MIGRNVYFDFGRYMCNLAFIATIILNFGLAWPDCYSKHKIQNCGGTESYF